MRKIKTLLTLAVISAFAAFPAFSIKYTEITIGGLTVKVPDDIVEFVNQNQDAIAEAFEKYDVTQSEIDSVDEKVLQRYSRLKSEYGLKTDNPYTTAVDGLNDFTGGLDDSILNTQPLQNVWAESWIGMLIPNVKFGFGINAGLASLDISPLKDAASALAIDEAENLNDTLAFPTATADLRLGGFILPFDIGFTISSIDSSKIEELDDKISPCEFDYFSAGGDLRFCILNKGSKLVHARISLSGGGYYTKGSVKVADKESSESSASFDFNSTTLFLGAQANAKLFCFVPFAGGRVAIAKTNIKWAAHADWLNILGDDSNGYIAKAVKYNILPSDFGNESESEWTLHPQVFGGIGIDLFIIDVSVSASYDFAKQILGAAASVRFSL